MRIHRPLVLASVKTLQLIFHPNRPRQADRVIEETLKSNKQWGSRDRAFIAETCYEIVRNWRMVLFCNELQENDLSELNFWQIVGSWIIIQNKLNSKAIQEELPQWEEFANVHSVNILARFKEAQKIRKIRESVPDWLDDLGETELGADKWRAEIEALNRQAPVVLRVNKLRTNQHNLQRLLGELNIETVIPTNLDELPDALLLEKRVNLANTKYFKDGFFEVQDAASQLVAPFLNVQSGMQVIDACAGAGGKTLHLAALMQNKGKITAMDVEERKLTELLKRAKRNSANIIEVALINPKTIQKYQEAADRLLLDVPCSGLGVIRRNPDAKWKLSLEFIENLKVMQWDILTQYSQMLKKGGKMVFATCSLLPSESEAHIQRLLAEQPHNWELIAERRTSTATEGYDGFYMACLLKKYK